jgi:hypothetical protein
MDSRTSSPSPRRASPRHSMQRQRSNSFPIVDALGCSTPEALLILAEGRAAVRKRRARRNQSVDDEVNRLFNPQDHLKFLESLAALPTPQDEPSPFDAKWTHSRMPSDATDHSTSTVVPHVNDGEPRNLSPTLGDYSANLAAFIKNQLKSIPTYQSDHRATSSLSPRSCPDLSFPRVPSSPNPSARRQAEGPKAIAIPPVRPPMKSQFSAWSSTDDETDDEALPLPEYIFSNEHGPNSKGSNFTPSILGYYETSHNSSFLFSSTPLEEASEPTTAKAFKFPDPSALPRSSPEQEHDDEEDEDDVADYPSSSCPSQPQLTSTSAPSYTSSSVSSSSYFDCKRLVITPQMKQRVIAAVTPPHPHKRLTAVSPWEGNAFSDVHDVYVESQHRVNVDGLSFDMLRDMNVSSRLTPC